MNIKYKKMFRVQIVQKELNLIVFYYSGLYNILDKFLKILIMCMFNESKMDIKI